MTKIQIKPLKKKSPKKKRVIHETKSRQRFLDAAEYFFAEYGYVGAKIRAIAERSKVNIGALHHYWGSKEELFTAVCQRRLLPMNEQRLRRFDELEEQAGESKIEIRALFRASLEPTFFLNDLSKKEQTVFRKFYSRALTDPSPIVGKVMREIFNPVTTRFFFLLRKLCLHLNDDEFYWRTNCILGTYLYAPAFSGRIENYAHPEFDVNDIELGITQIVEFLVAGMQVVSIENSGK